MLEPGSSDTLALGAKDDTQEALWNEKQEYRHGTGFEPQRDYPSSGVGHECSMHVTFVRTNELCPPRAIFMDVDQGPNKESKRKVSRQRS